MVRLETLFRALLDAPDRGISLSSDRREKDEGRVEKRGGVRRTKKTRKWDEGPSGQVKGNGDHLSRGLN
jgi:hypothetical protein